MDKEKKIFRLLKTSLVDYPKTVSSVIFFSGCNLRCPYCYNKTVVLDSEESTDTEKSSFSEIEAHLKKRKGLIQALVLTGGEALLSSYLSDVIKLGKANGYKIKLDTNGLLPERLSKLLEKDETRPDYVAMDIKTNPALYHERIPFASSDSEKLLKKSIEIISEHKEIEKEFRTVLVPPLISFEEINAIAKLLPKESSWFLSKFINKNLLDKSYENIIPYTFEQMNALLEYGKKIIPNIILR